MRFIDEISLVIRAGDGGNGAIAFRRERRQPRGGPCGGDGGRGGDVVLEVNHNLGTLLDLRSQPRLIAKRGGDGQGKDMHGRGAAPLVIQIPPGTEVYDVDTGENLGDLTTSGERLVVAVGGDGGRGNMRFSTPSNRAPRKSEPGHPGVSRTIRLELKLLADVGIIGLPNVGKSTIISRLSAARPKVADYPFTTLVPNLGVVDVGPGESFVMADIPGIVRGASEGVGLGHRFLRHVQRTVVLLHVIAPSFEEDGDPIADFEDLAAEVSAFDPSLGERPKVVALNKTDLPMAGEIEPAVRRLCEEHGLDFYPISAATGDGLTPLKRRLAELVRRTAEDGSLPS